LNVSFAAVTRSQLLGPDLPSIRFPTANEMQYCMPWEVRLVRVCVCVNE